jgi:hypothetical protein
MGNIVPVVFVQASMRTRAREARLDNQVIRGESRFLRSLMA